MADLGVFPAPSREAARAGSLIFLKLMSMGNPQRVPFYLLCSRGWPAAVRVPHRVIR